MDENILKKAVRFIKENENTSSAELAEYMGMSQRETSLAVQELISRGMVEKIGTKRFEELKSTGQEYMQSLEIDELILDHLREKENLYSIAELSMILGYSEMSTTMSVRRLSKEGKIKRYGNARVSKWGLSNYSYDLDNQVYIGDFSKIRTSRQLIEYLSNSTDRVDNKSHVMHYTCLEAVIAIISSRYWYIGNPHNMNDGLEYSHGSPDLWNKIFFSSFMAEEKESIAMWSMYAQPWAKGVKISIPAIVFKKWVREIKTVYRANPDTKQAIPEIELGTDKASVKIVKVAYCNSDSKIKSEQEKMSCGEAHNEIMTDLLKNRELVGYLKNEAWHYEKEIRLRIDLKDDIKFNAVAIKVPDYVIDSMVITAGPLFEGNLKEKIEEIIHKYKISTEESIFTGKFNVSSPCIKCEYRKNNDNREED